MATFERCVGDLPRRLSVSNVGLNLTTTLAAHLAATGQSSLSCGVASPWWVSWSSTHVAVGQQAYPTYERLRWSVPEGQGHDVSVVALASGPGDLFTGHWETPEAPGA